MAIRMLTARPPYKPNDIVTLDAATEAALVSEKVASTDLTGGTAYQAPVPRVYSGTQRAVACSAALIASPTAEMLADGVSEFVLDVAPFTRYRSDGTALVAIGGGLADGTNFYGVQSAVIPTEAPLAAATTTAAAICDGFTTIASDADCSGNVHQEWGGLQRGIFTRMEDGTLFVTYIQNNAGTDRLRLMRSPTGGGAGAWTQVTTVATSCFKSIQLRDRVRDQLILVTCEGANGSLQIKLRVFDSAGTQIGSTYAVNQPGKGFCQTLTTSGFYYEAGIGQALDRDGLTSVVLGGWTLPLPVSLQANTTQCCYKQVQWLLHDGAGSWTQMPVERFETGVRMDYDNMIVGADGDPDEVHGIYQGNVAMWESVGQFTPERLQPCRLSPVAAYAFDRFGVWWHNRRTGRFGFEETSPTMTWAIRPWDGDGSSFNASNDIPEARTRQAMFNAKTGEWWIVYKCIRPVPYAPGFTCTGSISRDVLTVTAVTGNPIKLGTNIISHSLATTGFLASKVIGVATTPGATDTAGAALTGSGGTGTYLLDTPQTLSSGTIGCCNGANPSTSQAPTTTWRIQVVTLKGRVRYDGELCSEGFGLMGLTQVASGRVYCMFLARGADNQQTMCHLWELTQQADGEVNSVSRALANSYNVTNNPVAGNVGFGTWATYLTGAQTLPARCSNQGPIFPDWQHGSKMTTNTLDILIARRATDHNGSGTATSASYDTASKMDHMRMRVPA